MLFNWLQRIRQGHLNVVRRPRRAIRGPVTAHVQTLEPRVLLSASPVGNEFQVNTFTTGSQLLTFEGSRSIATDSDGDFVVTWNSYGQDGSSYGVFAQRFNAAGVAQGAELQVNSYTTGFQRDGSAAMDADGNFVIAWAGENQGDSSGIFAQRYNADGVAQGAEFQVNTNTENAQQEASVAMDANGNFVVTWTGYQNASYGIYGQRYNAAGVAQGAEFQVAMGKSSSVAMDANGDFVVAWDSYTADGSGSGVQAQRFNAAGVAQGTALQVNTFTTGFQRDAKLAMDADGDYVVAWESSDFGTGQDGDSYGVFAQRFNSAGVAQGIEFQVNTTTTLAQWQPTVAMDADGDFIVSWSSQGDGDSYGVFAQRYNAAGVLQGGEFQVNTYTTGWQGPSSVAMDTDGDFVVAWSEYYGEDGNGNGIFAQRYDDVGPDDADDAGPIVSDVLVAGDTVQPGESLVSPPSAVTVRFSEDLSVAGGAGGASSVTNPANWRLTKNGVDASSLISGISFGLNGTTAKYEAVVTFTTPLTSGDYVLTAKSAITDLAGNALDGDRNGTPGGDFTQNLLVRTPQAQGSEFRVNTTTTGIQRTYVESPTAVATDAEGNFVVTWTADNQDGSGYGIYAQRYNAAGVAQGPEFQVNTFTTGNQRFSTVAMDADGDFVIAWTSNGQDGNSYGIFGQRYNAAGVAQGIEFQINTVTTGIQRCSTVAMDAEGNFIVVWQNNGQDGSDYGLYGQRFNAEGVAQGTEFQINTFTTGSQLRPAVAMDTDGDFIVTWSGEGQDPNGAGVYGQRYDAAGVAQGTEFQVNTFTTGTQSISRVAMDANGDFVVTWMSAGQDGSDYGIYGQRYNAAGVSQGAEFHVSSFTVGRQLYSTVAMDADGDFVVTWSSANQDGSSYGVFGQRYNAAGMAQGSEFAINSFTLNFQWQSSVAMDADGDFVVAWTSYLQDGSSDGVYAQRYAGGLTPTDLTLSANTIDENQSSGTAIGTFTTTDTDSPETFTYAFVAGVGDTDNASFQIVGNELRSNAMFNFEAQGTYSIRVQVTDSAGLTFDKQFTIDVNNLNEAPTMNGGMVTISENRPNGAAIGTFTATDPDIADPLTYSITAGNTGNAFAINSATGQITVNNSAAVNFELNQSFTLTVQATDTGMLSDTDTVIITVNDLNEQPYSFSKSFTLSENRSNGYVLGNITTGDEDAGQTLTYSITGGNPGNAFAINATTGQLTVNSVAAINFEDNPVFNMQITATDDGSPTHSRVGTAVISLTNLNEQPYSFSKSFTLSENRSNGYVLGNITTGDEDAGQTLTYSITGGNTGNAFAINATTGQLTVNSPVAINFEINPTFNLQITASDNGSPQQSRIGTAVINVADLNEQPYSFSKSFTLSENRSNGYVLGNITTGDEDAGQTLTYSITGGNPGNAFAINATTGQLTVNSVAAINFEINPVFNLQITATDNGNPAHNRVGTAVITLTDLNERPTLGNQTIGIIPENSPNGTVVGTVAAFDPDAGQTLTYAITGGNTGNAFAINNSTGQVTVNDVTALNFETTPTFNLQITVTDNGNPQQSRTATAVVHLTDKPEMIPPAFTTAAAPRRSLASTSNKSSGQQVASVATAITTTVPASEFDFQLTEPLLSFTLYEPLATVSEVSQQDR